jgi:hypothetical protein
VVEPNLRKWSGDHVSADPPLTAGVLITNAALSGGVSPRLIDIAPTVLRLFDVATPADIDGRPLFEPQTVEIAQVTPLTRRSAQARPDVNTTRSWRRPPRR